MLRRVLGRTFLRTIGWTVHGPPPDRDHIGVLLAAPHTSNHDFLLMLSTAWASDVRVKYLIKKEAFRGPAVYWWRFTGGIPTDRRNPGTLIEDLVARASSGEVFTLLIAREGTRKLGAGWKSGFYRIAVEAGVPVTPTSVDSATRRITYGQTFTLTGHVGADMDRLREFYADKGGVNPSNKSPVRLANEDAIFTPGSKRTGSTEVGGSDSGTCV